jgi:hypothetical protein
MAQLFSLGSMTPPMPSLDDLRSLFKRFKRAGWITDFTCDGDSFELAYTPLGRQRIRTLIDGSKDFRESGFEFTSLAAGEMRDCVSELLPPNFSSTEFMALSGFIDFRSMD